MQFKNLQAQLHHLIQPEKCLDARTYTAYMRLLKEDSLIKSDNPQKHCCVFFIPFNKQTQHIFIVHHKKAKQWIVPGGHIEKGELLEDALRREVNEELGITVETVGDPFLFSVMPVHNEGQPCSAHFDSWFIINANNLKVDLTEFNDTQWVSLEEAKKIITHATYLQALERIATYYTNL